MPRELPLTLHEAVMLLYAAGPDGLTGSGLPLWSASCAEKVRLLRSFETVRLAATGAAYASQHVVDEQHSIDVESLWVVKTPLGFEFLPARNQRYILDIVWTDRRTRIWARRTYYGVTPVSDELGSSPLDNTAGEYMSNVSFVAERCQPQAGGGGDVVLPVSGAGAVIPVGFFSTSPLWPDGAPLLGVYNFASALTLVGVRAVAGQASIGTNTVLVMEVNGVDTGVTITLTAGALGAPASASLTGLSVVVPAGQTIRWKVQSGPAAVENAATLVSVFCQFQPT